MLLVLLPVGAQLTASAPFDGGRMAAGKLLFLENNVYNPPDPPISGVEELTAQHDLSAMAAYRDGLFLNHFILELIPLPSKIWLLP